MTTAASRGHGFGPMPVFLAGISTILGAIMFLRFGYAVGNLGLLGAFLMIFVGHLVTVPTALALSEIATNRRVEGGGEYFIISRSFGLRVGAAIGSALYLSQAVSVAFYCIALGEAARPLAPWITELTSMPFDARMVSGPSLFLLAVLMLTKGADMGVKVLYIVAATLTASLILFFLGSPVELPPDAPVLEGPPPVMDSFFVVFAICFPGFTGMTAGVGLSGDLARPRRALPIGTMAATGAGLLIYLAIVWKLSVSAPPELLATDQLVMAKISLWGPGIYIGLAAAALSSAIGSILVAPRTLQALAKDACLPFGGVNRILARGKGESNDPQVGTLVTVIVAAVFVGMGDVDFVARLISLFFMVTYGALCAISFLQHFSANPSYRPSFKTRWYVSLFGALLCLALMFQMDPLYSLVAIAVLASVYLLTGVSAAGKKGDGLAVMVRGAMTQTTRFLHVRLQRGPVKQREENFRPSIIHLSSSMPTEDTPTLQMLEWLCARHGFGTFLHRIDGYLDGPSAREAGELKLDLVSLAHKNYPSVFVEALVSPSDLSALAQALQLPGVSGIENNTLLIDCPQGATEKVVENASLATSIGKNLLLLRANDPKFGKKRKLHVWLGWHDAKNADFMLLLAYMILGHDDWKNAELEVFAAFPTGQVDAEETVLNRRLEEGRVPIGQANLRFLTVDDGEAYRAKVAEISSDADLVMMGISPERLEEKGADLLSRHSDLSNLLFVCTLDSVSLE